MKKYMVYFMSLLMLAGITNSALQGAAVPERDGGEEEIKEWGNPTNIAFGWTNFTHESRAYGNATNSRILKLTQEIKELKQQISQQKRAGWWEWITTWKKNRAEFHGVSGVHIGKKTKEKHDLERQLEGCKNKLFALREENQADKNKFYGMPPAIDIAWVPLYFNYVKLLVRVTKKTDRKRDLMLEKFKLQRILENLERSNATTY